ncbi:MAG: LysE family transporter [Thermodesulfobacteriota bacterium]
MRPYEAIVTLSAIFFSSFLITLSGAMMPGPLLTTVISESSRRGFSAGPLLILGHVMLELVMVAALLLGLAPYLQQQGVFAFVAIAGAAVLLRMAFTMFRSLPALTLRQETGAPQRRNLLLTGIVLSAFSPYWVIWWATIGLGCILQSHRLGTAGIVLFFIGHLLADFLWYSAVSGAVAGGRRFLSDRLYRGIIGACAALLVLFAGYFIHAGLQRIIA